MALFNTFSLLLLIYEHEPNNSIHLALASSHFRLFVVKLWNRKQKNNYKFLKYLERFCTFEYKFYTYLLVTLKS